MATFTEANYEKAVISVFRDTLRYNYIHAPNLTRDYSEPLYIDELLPALRQINPKLPEAAIKEAVYKLRNFEGGTFWHKNVQFMDYLQNGVSVNFYDNGEQQSKLVYFVDYKHKERNTFTVANQWTINENSKKRLDIIVFLNGIPVVVVELKSPSRDNTDASEAFNQLRNYMHEIPSLFTYNAFLVMSDLATSKAGTITSGEDRFMEWKTKDGGSTQYAQYETFFEGMFDKTRFLDIIQNFICFSGDVKILGAYHQYYAVRKAVESTANAVKTDGKGGVFRHTQGSGKSLSMIFYAHLLQNTLNSPTIVVLTDRNDLDDQLFGHFARCAQFLRQRPIQATGRTHLKEELRNREANGIIFTTIQKIEEYDDALSDRRNIIVMADEAHRSQFVDEKVTEDGKIKKSFGLMLRESLPNATYIGFTGTPIAGRDRSTMEVFGNYIDIYDMTQAVDDGATRPIYYESRVIHLKLDNDILKLIDAEYEIMAQQAEEHIIEKSKKELGKMESILGAEDTITALCEDIIRHYEDSRQHELTGKAMIVAYNRNIAMGIYNKLREMRPKWTEKVGIIMTENNKDRKRGEAL